MEKAKEAGLEKDVEAAVERVEKGVEDKVEDGVKVALWDIYGPHPSLALVKFWQGVVELCLEITVIVSVLPYQPPTTLSLLLYVYNNIIASLLAYRSCLLPCW